jgi:streptogramin lyase
MGKRRLGVSRPAWLAAFGLVAMALSTLALLPPAARSDGGARAEDITSGFGAVWTTGAGGVVRIDPHTGQVTTEIRGASSGLIPTLSVGDGVVWELVGGRVTQIDPRSDRVVGRPIRLPRPSFALAASAGALWAADYNNPVLRKLDPRTGHLLAAIRGIGLHVEAIAATKQAIWVASLGPWSKNSHGEITPLRPGTVSRVDPRSGRIVARIRVGRGPGTIAVGAESIWVANFRGLRPDFSVSRIDPRTNRVVATIKLHRLLAGIAVGAGAAWILNPGRLFPSGGLDMSGGTLIRIDPRTNHTVVRRLPGSSRPAAITFAHGSLWIGSPGNGCVLHVDPKTMKIARIPIPFA